MTAAWSAALGRARAALSRGAFGDAQRQAEALLQAPLPRDMRRQALLVAADAAYGTRAYSTAARHYGVLAAEAKDSPEASRAALALGWARLRSGDRNGARAAWIGFADTRPADARGPLALVLAAEVARQAGDLADAERLLDRLVAWYPSTAATAPGLLSRASLRLQRKQEAAALRDVDEAIRVHGPAALEERQRLIEALASNDREPVIEPPSRSGGNTDRPSGEPLERFAERLLDRRHREATPYLLHAVVLLAAQRGWAEPLTGTLASRLVEDFPSYPPAPHLLARVADAASIAGRWSLARQSWETIHARAPLAMGRGERLRLAEAQLRTGESTQARRQLEQLAMGGGEEAPRALLLLAQTDAAAGDRRAALAAYERLQDAYPRFPRPAESLLAQAQLLADLGQHGRARPLLQKAVEVSGGDVAAEAAFRLGQGFQAERQYAAAAEWYLTAVYVAERSTWGRQALLGAGQSLARLNEKEQALAAYWKLLSSRDGADSADDRRMSGEAAYHVGEILRDADLRADGLVMFQTSANLTPGSPAERQALLEALQSLVALGDRQAAEVVYRRLQQVGADESQLARARQILRQRARATPDGAPTEFALPALAR
jgi:TolA-binding protein